MQESSEMANYVKKTTPYRLLTKVLRKLMLFIKLTGGSFLQGQFFLICRVLCF